MREHVLQQLQSAHLCNDLERRGLRKDDDLSDRDHGSGYIQYFVVEAGAHTLAVPQKAAAQEADEEGFSSECEDSLFWQVPDQGNRAEYS